MEEPKDNLDLTDYFAVEAMKILLSNESILNHFAVIPAYSSRTQLEAKKTNAQTLAEACYRIATEMRKARLGAFK